MALRPRFTITHRLLANAKKIAKIVTDLNGRSLSKTTLLAFEAGARAISAHASTN